ncbi:hypothetical protein [Streptomyces sp. NPDC127092]|uniref:hypothetical protein n=1 Tax=Streptomyces sp. NPDC127092 TaxID=3347135 RepID=UPI003657164D
MSILVSALIIGLAGVVVGTYRTRFRPRSRSRRSARPAVDPWVRDSFVPAAYGLVPREVLDAGRAGPAQPLHRLKEMQAVADSAWSGDWRPAAAYVAAAGDDWDERWSRTEVLQQIAGDDDEWLEAWRSEQPENGDAATLHASMLLHRAWEIRGSEYAHKVPAERMNQFQAMLPQSMTAAVDASRIDPRNPGPWVVMITAARALSYSHNQFRALWAGLTARAPYHYSGHWQALQYWCGKWHGSDRLMLDFARLTVERAPAGSPMAGTYLHALRELDGRGGTGGARARKSRELLERVAWSLGQVAPDNEALPRLRHLLAHYLLEARSHDAALEQFRLIGRWCGAHPWNDSDDPVAAFDHARGLAAKGAKRQAHDKGTATMPL